MEYDPGSDLPIRSSDMSGAIDVSASASPLDAAGSALPPSGTVFTLVRWEFVRYLVVGGTATVFDAATLYSVTEFLKVNYLISAPIGFMVGTVVNYILSRSWVFQRRRLKNQSAELTIFTLIGVVGLGLNEGILWFFQSRLGIFYLFAKGVSACVVLVWNFGARKLLLFR